MGKTSFSGPVYGAKSLIWSHTQLAGTVSTAATNLAQFIVPAGQDFIFTDLHVQRATVQSTGLTVSIVDDSSRATTSSRVLGTVAITSSAANALGSTAFVADPGEYEGRRVAALSTVSLRLHDTLSSAAALASSGLQVWAFGYIRFVSSTRAE